MLKRCMKTELKKAIFNRAMLGVLTFAVMLSLLQAFSAIHTYREFCRYLEDNISGNPMVTQISLFVRWLGADGTSFASTAFFFLFPLLAVVPYGWSLVQELHSGYAENMLCRVSRRTYFMAKYLAAFISAGVAVVLPLLINVAVLALFLPALKAEMIYPTGNLWQRSMWSAVFYENPLVYTGLYILLDGFYAGLVVSVSTACAFLAKHRVQVMLIPFFGMLAVDYIDTNLHMGYDVSPIKFLRALPVSNDHHGGIILAEGIFILGITIGLTIYKGCKYEVL